MTLLSDQLSEAELTIILSELSKVLDKGVKGAVVEFGCYTGTAAVPMARMLHARTTVTKHHVYDSFAGLPPKQPQDSSPAGEQFIEGELRASKAELVNNFRKAGLKLPHIHKAWFEDLQPADIPDEIGFAFLDGDYYQSIAVSLRLIEERLAPGAVIVVDDYANLALPGAARATDEWLLRHPAKLRVQSSLAIIYPY